MAGRGKQRCFGRRVREMIDMSQMLVTEFKGRPLVKLIRDMADPYPFQFGLRKAQMIVEHYDKIRDFVEKQASAGSPD